MEARAPGQDEFRCVSIFTSRSVVEDHYREQVVGDAIETVLSSLLSLCRPWWGKSSSWSGKDPAQIFYCLNVFSIELPTLRERRADIPQLVAFCLSQFSKQLGKKIGGVSRESMENLVNYPWPENIRELQNVIERDYLVGGPDPPAGPRSCSGVGSVAGIHVGGIDQLVPMEIPILSLPASYRRSHGFLLSLFKVNDGLCSSA